jgi:biopolymer transport protein ExbD
MARNHKKHRGVGLNLVSLMDIFTILVFFLLVNSSEVEVLPNNKAVHLPQSIAEEKPRETVIVTITGDDILVQGRAVASVAAARAAKGGLIEPLRAALVDQAGRTLRRQGGDNQLPPEVTIVGDKAISYHLLKKVMATCTRANYGAISLAVLQKSVDAHG